MFQFYGDFDREFTGRDPAVSGRLDAHPTGVARVG